MITRKAEQIYLMRIKSGASGNSKTDWKQAEEYIDGNFRKKVLLILSDETNREVVKVLISAFGLGATALAATGLLLTFWDTLEDRKLTQQRLISDRFSKSVDLLAKEDLNAVVGAIYALERITKDSPKDQWTIVELLAGYVPLRKTEKPSVSKTELLPDYVPLRKTGEANSAKSKSVQAALTVLARRNQKQDYLGQSSSECQRIDLSGRLMAGYFLNNAKFGSKYFFLLSRLKLVMCPGANLVGSDLSGAYLLNADLSGADLRQADLIGVNLNGSDLSEADLIGADLFKATLFEANLSRAYLREATLFEANLNGANLSQTDLSEADLREANLSQANLNRAGLYEAKLTGADLVRTRFFKANLTGANLTGANLSEADLRQARLFDAKLIWADLGGADLRGANLSGADLTGANVGGADFRGAYICNTTMPDGTTNNNSCPV